MVGKSPTLVLTGSQPPLIHPPAPSNCVLACVEVNMTFYSNRVHDGPGDDVLCLTSTLPPHLNKERRWYCSGEHRKKIRATHSMCQAITLFFLRGCILERSILLWHPAHDNTLYIRPVREKSLVDCTSKHVPPVTIQPSQNRASRLLKIWENKNNEPAFNIYCTKRELYTEMSLIDTTSNILPLDVTFLMPSKDLQEYAFLSMVTSDQNRTSNLIYLYLISGLQADHSLTFLQQSQILTSFYLGYGIGVGGRESSALSLSCSGAMIPGWLLFRAYTHQ